MGKNYHEQRRIPKASSLAKVKDHEGRDLYFEPTPGRLPDQTRGRGYSVSVELYNIGAFAVDALLATQLYGSTREEVVSHLVRLGLESMSQGKIDVGLLKLALQNRLPQDIKSIPIPPSTFDKLGITYKEAQRTGYIPGEFIDRHESVDRRKYSSLKKAFKKKTKR